MEQVIHIVRNEGNILLLGNFNDRTETNHNIVLSNDSNPNPLWLDEDLVLASRYNINSKDLVENLFGNELVNLYNSQHIKICNSIIEWPKSNQMTCIHGLSSIFMDYVIFVFISNQIVNFDLLNDHEFDSDHKPLTLTLNMSMYKSHI